MNRFLFNVKQIRKQKPSLSFFQWDKTLFGSSSFPPSILAGLMILIVLSACESAELSSDAYGNFEATSVMVSAETPGKLLMLHPQEGQDLAAGQYVALIDTQALHLQRKLLDAQIGILPQKLRSALADIEVMKNQLANLIRERDRVQRLVEKKAATTKQLDDLNGEIQVMEKRIQSVESNTRIANRSILAEKEPLLAQKAIIEEKIRRAYVYNPLGGTVLTRLAEAGEMVGTGSPLYRIAQLDTIKLRFYVSGEQLPGISLGDQVEVLIDAGTEDYTSFEGTVSWIASEAEFTPKTIQTKEERVNLVYAVEARVPNPDGKLKIGMPAEVNFYSQTLANQ